MQLEKEQFIEYLSKIPNLNEQLKGFLLGLNSTYYAYNETTKELTVDEVWIKGVQFMIILDMRDVRKVPVISFRDDIVEPTLASEQFGVPLELLETKLNTLIESLSKLGCDLVQAGVGGNEEYLWYDLIIPREIFTVKLLVTCAIMWNSYNKYAYSIINEYRKADVHSYE